EALRKAEVELKDRIMPVRSMFEALWDAMPADVRGDSEKEAEWLESNSDVLATRLGHDDINSDAVGTIMMRGLELVDEVAEKYGVPGFRWISGKPEEGPQRRLAPVPTGKPFLPRIKLLHDVRKALIEAAGDQKSKVVEILTEWFEAYPILLEPDFQR